MDRNIVYVDIRKKNKKKTWHPMSENKRKTKDCKKRKNKKLIHLN